jgi:hypothetical protein
VKGDVVNDAFEWIEAVDALARVGLAELAEGWTNEQRSRLVRWRGHPTPFSCGDFAKVELPGFGCRTVRTPASYAGTSPIVFSWSTELRTFLAVTLEQAPGKTRQCLAAIWAG